MLLCSLVLRSVGQSGKTGERRGERTAWDKSEGGGGLEGQEEEFRRQIGRVGGELARLRAKDRLDLRSAGGTDGGEGGRCVEGEEALEAAGQETKRESGEK